MISTSKKSYTTDNIDTTEINNPSSILLSQSDSSFIKESTIKNSEKKIFSTNKITSNQANSIKSTNIFTDFESITTYFSEKLQENIDITFIKQSTESITKTSKEPSILITNSLEHLDVLY